MHKIIFAIIFLSLTVHAQFTKVFEKPATASAYIYAYDAERLNEVYPSYVAYQSGSTVSILNLNTLTVEYTADISPITAATAGTTYSVVNFYKNLLQSDGKWTALVYTYNTTSYNVGLFSEGKFTATTIMSSTSAGYPTLKPAGGKIYLVANTGSSIEVYLVRNNVPSTSAIWDNSKYMAALEKMNVKKGNGNHFNALGQQIPEIQYQELQDFMKKSLFQK